MSNSLLYHYTHEQTAATTGYFSCEPQPEPGLKELARLIASRPLDSFLRRHALRRFLRLPLGEAAALLKAAGQELAAGQPPNTPADEASEKTLPPSRPLDPPLGAPLSAFARELLWLNPALSEDKALNGIAASVPLEQALYATPLLYLRLQQLNPADLALSGQWAKIFTDNINGHRALPLPGVAWLPPAFPEILPANNWPQADLPKVHQAFSALYHAPEANSLSALPTEMSAQETASLALERLTAADIFIAAQPDEKNGGEMRHQASLSPIALLHPWKLTYKTDCGRSSHQLHGRANTYGRGLSLPAALASCRMEAVERASAYASTGFVEGRPSVLNLAKSQFNFAASDNPALATVQPGELVYGSLSELKQKGLNPVDPNFFCLEVPYTDAPLFWLKGQRLLGVSPQQGVQYESVLAPFQMLYLFANLDEIDLAFAPPSTGLAAHSTMAGAKLAALTELLEREAEATTPYSKSSCFTLEAQDLEINALLRDYRARGINVQFQDISGPLGFPCYQAFVIGAKGAISRGYGAGLSARKAILSALTETPYPYPDGPPSGPPLRNLPVRILEDLPDYSLHLPERTGDAPDVAGNLLLMESLFCANNLNPVYVEMTRRDLGFPVVRALAPGLASTAEFDEYSRLPTRLYQNYLQLINCPGK